MKIGVIGSGQVGQVLADGFIKHGHEVMRGSRDPGKLAEWKAGTGDKGSTGTFEDTADFGELVVIAVKGTAAEDTVKACASHLAGKTVIDANNPIADAAPANGVLQYFTSPNESLMERLQNAAPEANFVKAFSCVGNALMINPDLPGGPPTMFICGNNDDAKAQVRGLLDELGWEIADMGAVESARAIEPLCQLWCVEGFRNGNWGHAFKMLRP